MSPREPKQARSTITRARLLDAAIECLVERGYAGTTATAVSEIAGVSRGAKLHHFRTREELVVSAAEHLSMQMLELVRKGAAQVDPEDDPIPAVLDQIWDAFSGPLYAAACELWVATRTDASLRAVFEPVELKVGLEILKTCQELLPAEVTARDEFRQDLECVLNMLQGLALTRIVRVNHRLKQHTLEVCQRVLTGEARPNGSG